MRKNVVGVKTRPCRFDVGYADKARNDYSGHRAIGYQVGLLKDLIISMPF